MTPYIIDTHTHVFPDDIVLNRDKYLSRDLSFQSMYSDHKALLSSGKELLTYMKEFGIEKSVVNGFGWSSNEMCKFGNDTIIKLVKSDPEKIVGFGTVAPLESLDVAIGEIERLSKAGIKGIGEIRPDTQGLFDMDDESLSLLAMSIRKNRMILLLHVTEPVGHIYPGKGNMELRQIERLLTFFVGIPIILSHLGGGLPFYAYMPEVRKYLDKVWFDTAALPFLYESKVLDSISNAIGVEKILFGSDFPLMKQDRIIDYIDNTDLSDTDKEKIFCHNWNDLLRSTNE
jgi:predicted TIM-barrel fold metal-dependent hydrolase